MSENNGKKKYQIDMCSGSILKKMLLFAVPLMCSSILQLLFNAADIIVVGRYAGDNSLAAVKLRHCYHIEKRRDGFEAFTDFR